MRIIDSKYSAKIVDGEIEIVKTATGEIIPEDEPLFLIRAKDRLAAAALDWYRRLCVNDGCTSYQLDAMTEIIAEFKRFAEDHPERMKQPSVTRGM